MLNLRINTAPIHKQLLDGLRRAIVAGDLKPGQKLKESDLSNSAGVSRTVVREALRQLETEGLITATRNKGAIVRALSVDEAKDIYCIRAFIEGLAARLFTERATQAHVDRLAQAVEATLEAYSTWDVKKILARRDAFYEALLAGVESDVLATMLRSLNARIAHWRAIPLSHPGRSKKREKEVRNELKQLLKAIQTRNAEAAEAAARAHVEGIASEVMRLFEKENIDQMQGGNNNDC